MSDTPADPTPKPAMGLDARLSVVSTTVIVVWILGGSGIVTAVLTGVAAVIRHFIPVNGSVVVIVVTIVLGFAGIVGIFAGAAWTLKRATANLAAPYAAVRRAAREPAIQRGWAFEAAGPAPSKEVIEAVFHMSQMPLVGDRTTEVITGTIGAYPFRASHLEGHETGFGSNTSDGPEHSENIIELTLPGLLPELRFRDRLASKTGDYGIKMPSIPTGNAAVDKRWDLQCNFPEAVRQLLTPDLLAYLASVPPVRCTMVVRVGKVISCRDKEGSFESITARLDILRGLADRIPATEWNRATPAQAGAGYYQIKIARPNIVVWKSERVVDDADPGPAA